MANKLKTDSIASELSGVESLLSKLDPNDLIGRRSLEYFKNKLSTQLRDVAQMVDNTGRVVLAFEGGPVNGSRGIDTSFAAKSLERYQDLIAKQVVAQDAQMAKVGPIPSRNLTKLNITNVVHGSFGFELEEIETDQMGFVDSPVKTAIAAVDDVLSSFASGNDDVFRMALANVDRRVFISIKRFYDNMYRNSAALKITEQDRDIVIDRSDVLRARNRIADVSVEDIEYQLQGELLGLTPISRRFDLRVVESDVLESGRVLVGQVGQRLSDDYLERLSGSERVAGRTYSATIIHRVARRVDGITSEAFTLIDLSSSGSAVTSQNGDRPRLR